MSRPGDGRVEAECVDCRGVSRHVTVVIHSVVSTGHLLVRLARSGVVPRSQRSRWTPRREALPDETQAPAAPRACHPPPRTLVQIPSGHREAILVTHIEARGESASTGPCAAPSNRPRLVGTRRRDPKESHTCPASTATAQRPHPVSSRTRPAPSSSCATRTPHEYHGGLLASTPRIESPKRSQESAARTIGMRCLDFHGRGPLNSNPQGATLWTSRVTHCASRRNVVVPVPAPSRLDQEAESCPPRVTDGRLGRRRDNHPSMCWPSRPASPRARRHRRYATRQPTNPDAQARDDAGQRPI